MHQLFASKGVFWFGVSCPACIAFLPLFTAALTPGSKTFLLRKVPWTCSLQSWGSSVSTGGATNVCDSANVSSVLDLSSQAALYILHTAWLWAGARTSTSRALQSPLAITIQTAFNFCVALHNSLVVQCFFFLWFSSQTCLLSEAGQREAGLFLSRGGCSPAVVFPICISVQISCKYQTAPLKYNWSLLRAGGTALRGVLCLQPHQSIPSTLFRPTCINQLSSFWANCCSKIYSTCYAC